MRAHPSEAKNHNFEKEKFKSQRENSVGISASENRGNVIPWHPHPGPCAFGSSPCPPPCDDFVVSTRMRRCAPHTGANNEVTQGRRALVTYLDLSVSNGRIFRALSMVRNLLRWNHILADSIHCDLSLAVTSYSKSKRCQQHIFDKLYHMVLVLLHPHYC